MMKKTLFIIVFTITNIIQTITGFAGSMLAMPLGIKLIGIDTSRVVLNIAGTISCIFILKDHWRSVNRKDVLKVIKIMLPGIIMGQILFSISSIDFLLNLYGGFIIVIAVKNILWNKEFRLGRAGENIILFIAGIIHGMFVSGGSLLVIYAMDKWKDKTVFRANLSAIWCILNGTVVIMHFSQGLFTKDAIQLVGICIIPALGSAVAGEWLQRKIKGESFYRIANVLLVVCGFLLIK